MTNRANNVASRNHIPPRFFTLELETSKLRREKSQLICARNVALPHSVYKIIATTDPDDLVISATRVNLVSINIADILREAAEKEIFEKKIYTILSQSLVTDRSEKHLEIVPRSSPIVPYSNYMETVLENTCRNMREIYFLKIDVKSIGANIVTSL